MESTSSPMPVCVYCGTPRPADESSCPRCGRSWIDVRVEDGDAGAAVAGGAAVGAAAAANESGNEGEIDDAASGASGDAVEPTQDTTPTVPIVPPPPPSSLDDTGEFSFDDWTLPPDKPPSRAKWIIPILLLIAVVIVWAFVFVDRGGSPTTTVEAATTTVPETTTTVADTTTTTVADTTTTTAATTTTIAVPPPSVWPPVGDPIPTDELGLRAAGIGPIEIGDGIGEVAGRLTASLGEAESSGVDGLCPVGEGYWLQWGELRAVFDGFESGATFVSYYYEDVGSDTSLGLTTLSGLALGDTVADLTRIYSSFTIAFEVIDGVDVFRLIDGGELLLWGPVTSTDADGLIEGIYSPGPCSDV